MSKSCSGPNSNGTVSPGQNATCIVSADTTSGSFIVGDQLRVTPTGPIGATAVQCTPQSGASYQTSASQILNRCDFTVTSGSVANGQVIGTEVIAIPATATPGSTIQQTVIWCFGVLSGDGACKAVPSSVPVSGPGAVVKGNQTISFPAISTHTFGDTSFNLDAVASSGLPVSVAASGPCTVSGAVVTITGGGVCTITASQSGDSSYNPATPVVQSFNIDCFPGVVPLAVSGISNVGSTLIADLVLTDAHTGPGGGCGGTFTAQVPMPAPLAPLPIASGTFTASTSGTVATGILTGTVLSSTPIPFSATLTLDVVSRQGSISETFNTQNGPVTITVSFVQNGGVYVITGVTGPPS